MNRSHPIQVELVSLFRFCQVIRWLMVIFLLVQVVFFVLAWIIPMPLTLGQLQVNIAPEAMLLGKVSALSVAEKSAGIMLGVPGLVALSYGIFQLGRALNGFQQGRIFAADTIANLRGCAGGTLLSITLFIAEPPLRAFLFNLIGNGNRYTVSMDMSSNELLLILVCGLFYLIAGVMHEGRRLSEENEGFI